MDLVALHKRKQFFLVKTFYFSCLDRFLSFCHASAQFKHFLKAEFTVIYSAYFLVTESYFRFLNITQFVFQLDFVK